VAPSTASTGSAADRKRASCSRRERRSRPQGKVGGGALPLARIGGLAGLRVDAPLRFTLATGLRQGELLGLLWKDVDLDAATVDVRRTRSYVGGKVAFLPPKTDRSRRTVELSQATCNLLANHRVAQTEHRLQLGEVWQDNDLVFPSLIGTPWLPRHMAIVMRQTALFNKMATRWPQLISLLSRIPAG